MLNIRMFVYKNAIVYEKFIVRFIFLVFFDNFHTLYNRFKMKKINSFIKCILAKISRQLGKKHIIKCANKKVISSLKSKFLFI